MSSFDSLEPSLSVSLNFTGLAPHLPELMSLPLPLCCSCHSGGLTRQVAHFWASPQQGSMEQLCQGLRGYGGGLISRLRQCLLLLQGQTWEMKLCELFHCPTLLPSPERSFPELFFSPQSAGPAGAQRVPDWAESQDWRRGSQMPITLLPLPLSLFPQAMWAFGEHLGQSQQGREEAGRYLHFPLSDALPPTPGLCGGSGSTSQPLLLQCPAFSLGFCLCSVVLPLFLCSLCPLPWSLAGGSELGIEYLASAHCLCSSVFVHTSKNICVCCAWHLCRHLHLPPWYPACFCRLRRHPPHPAPPQRPQPFFLDLTPETLLKAPLINFPNSIIWG